jgi:hypothetical protein
MFTMQNLICLLGGWHKSKMPRRGTSTPRNRAMPEVEALEQRWCPAQFNVRNFNDAGAGSLRQAIIDANNSNDASSTISFANIAGTVSLQSALPDLTKNITITAPANGGAIVDNGGVALNQVFNIPAGSECDIDFLTIQNCSGAGVVNSGSLELNGCTVSYCGSSGILVRAGSSLDMYNCLVTNNNFNALSTWGGGIFDVDGNVYCEDCQIFRNTADIGGGIASTSLGNQVTLVNCSVQFNTAASKGGGIYIDNGTLSVTGQNSNQPGCKDIDQSLMENSAGSAGGGFYLTGSQATASFSGATVAQNQVTGGKNAGGGCALEGGMATFTSLCIISSNTATTGSAIAWVSPGSGYSIDPTCTVSGTIQTFTP